MPRSPALAATERTPRRGHGRVTLADVATAAGVTAITVSRYVRGEGYVSAETAERIRNAIGQTGYVPNKTAGGLASGGSRMVAALLPNIANSIFGETAQGLAEGLSHAGYELMLGSTSYSMEREEEQLRAVLGWQPAALVVTGRHHSAAARALLRATQARGTPVIELWDHHDPGSEGFAQVGFNHDEVGHAMAAHLLDRGHRKLAYIDSGVSEDFRAHDRGVAFAAAAKAAGAQVQLVVGAAGDAFDAGRDVIRRLVQGAGKGRAKKALAVSALAFANDHLACGALLEAARSGIRVPQDLALLGFGDFALARQLLPPLSSVSLPRHAIGAQAAACLVAALEGDAPAASATLPWEIVARESTGTEAPKR
jgi:LacI family transcriptional regulator, gluconate utilization system Gnt-I transcriptional repressor